MSSANATTYDDLRSRYAGRLLAEDDGFWRDRRHARYATLVRVRQPERIAPTAVAKSDRRAWVTLDRGPRRR